MAENDPPDSTQQSPGVAGALQPSLSFEELERLTESMSPAEFAAAEAAMLAAWRLAKKRSRVYRRLADQPPPRRNCGGGGQSL